MAVTDIKMAEVAPDKHRARKARLILGRVIRDAIDFHGTDFAGFALVTWDMRGGAHSGYFAEVGMVSESLMPTFAHDALNRHLAAVIAERASSNRIDGD
jgi:hypothetical protein